MLNKLINQIISLPTISLTQEERSIINEIVAFLPEQNIDAFQKKITELEIEIKPKKHHEITSYLTVWFKLSQTVSEWSQHLSRLWTRVAHSALTAENLMPLIIELLPSDLEKLKLIDAKLQAIQIENGATYYFLTTLCIAIGIKQNEIDKNPLFYEPEKNEDKYIRIVISELPKDDEVNLLKLACLDYMNNLLDHFKRLLESTEKELYLAYFTDQSPEQDHHKIMETIIGKFNENTFYTADLITLMEKYIAMREMFYTLLRKNIFPSKILIEFAEKFSHFSKLFQNDASEFSTLFWKAIDFVGLNHATVWLSLKSSKARFLSEAGLFTQRNRDANCSIVQEIGPREETFKMK